MKKLIEWLFPTRRDPKWSAYPAWVATTINRRTK